MNGMIDQFADLWGCNRHKYVIVRTSDSNDGLDGCIIVDRATKAAELIDDDSLATEVMQRMVAAGVPIVSDLSSVE